MAEPKKIETTPHIPHLPKGMAQPDAYFRDAPIGAIFFWGLVGEDRKPWVLVKHSEQYARDPETGKLHEVFSLDTQCIWYCNEDGSINPKPLMAEQAKAQIVEMKKAGNISATLRTLAFEIAINKNPERIEQVGITAHLIEFKDGSILIFERAIYEDDGFKMIIQTRRV